MKFYVFTTPQGDTQVINCDNFVLAIIGHKQRAKAGDNQAQKWLKALAQATPIEAIDASHAKELYSARR